MRVRFVALCSLVIMPVIGSAVSAPDDFSHKVDRFIDKMLLEMLTRSHYDVLEPVKVQHFEMRVPSRCSHDSGVVSSEGRIGGISEITRRGKCSYNRMAGTNPKITCELNLASVKVRMPSVLVIGEMGDRRFHRVSTLTAVNGSKTSAQIEIEGRQARIIIKKITMKVSVLRGKRHLNCVRRKLFKRQISDELSRQLSRALTGAYTRALNEILLRRFQRT